jgi:hypothetical protein
LLFVSDHNPLDLIERDLVAAPVVEAGSPGRLMGGHLLGGLQPAAVLEVGRYPGGAEGVAADLGLDAGLAGPPANHPPDIGLEQGIGSQLPGAALDGAEQWPLALLLAVLADAGGRNVLLKVAVEIVVGRHLVFLAALLVQPDPAPAPLHKEVFDPHGDRRAHARKGVDHQTDQSAIAQTGKGSGVDRVEQGPRLVGLEYRRLAAPLRVLGAAHGVRRVHRNYLAHHHPIEEHPQGGQPLLHGGLRVLAELGLDEGRYVDRLDLGQIHDADSGTVGGELPDGFQVGAAGVGIADVGAEEVAHPLAGLWLGREDGGQGRGLDLDCAGRHGSIIRMIKDIIMRKQQGIGRGSKLTLCVSLHGCPKPPQCFWMGS